MVLLCGTERMKKEVWVFTVVVEVTWSLETLKAEKVKHRAAYGMEFSGPPAGTPGAQVVPAD